MIAALEEEAQFTQEPVWYMWRGGIGVRAIIFTGSPSTPILPCHCQPLHSTLKSLIFYRAIVYGCSESVEKEHINSGNYDLIESNVWAS